MYAKKIKLIILLIVLGLSITITIFFVVNLSYKNHNLKDLNDEYDINIESVDDKQNNLNPEIIFKSIDKNEINRSIDIKLKVSKGSIANPIELFYQPSYNRKLFEFIFLKNIIRTFPQWKVNTFKFSYDSLNQAVWVKYKNDKNEDYLNWFFRIISKI